MEEKRGKARADERGISPRALAATATNEAPGPGAERTPWVGSRLAAGARPPTGAANKTPRGRALARTLAERLAREGVVNSG
ncbi:MAG: hypothetical protein LM580_01270 [Thermofilum sp.]|nr:hypothetical protein [Thermofilum sp.]